MTRERDITRPRDDGFNVDLTRGWESVINESLPFVVCLGDHPLIRRAGPMIGHATYRSKRGAEDAAARARTQLSASVVIRSWYTRHDPEEDS